MNIDLYTWLILSALAAFRVAELLVIDTGPFDVFMYFRGWSVSQNPILKTIGAGLNCVHCTGLYISIIFAFGYFWQNIYIFGILLAFAIAGLQSIFALRFGRT
jgi:uncharacterized protein DUF1360